MCDVTPGKPPRPRNVLMQEFPSANKEAASQALRDTSGDLQRARELLKRRLSGDDADDAAPPPPPVEDEAPPPPPAEDDVESYESESDIDDEAWQAQLDGIYNRKKKPKAKKPKLSDEEKERRKAEREKQRDERKAAKARDEAKMKENRAKILSGRQSATEKLEQYAGTSSFRGVVGDRRNFEDAELLYVKSVKCAENDWGQKYQRLHTFVLEGRDVVQWWTNTTNEEAKLLTEGCGVDFAGTITKHATYEGVDITTVNRIKVHKVDGAQIAKPGKEKIKGGVGHVLGEDDDDPEMASPSPKKKPRVAGGATRQKKTDKALLKDDEIDYEDDETEKQAEGNDWLKQLAKERAQRR